MVKLAVIDTKGQKLEPIVLEFGDKEYSAELIKQAVVTHQSNQRLANGATKTRGEVRGGGRKPFKQKGTGNARAGTRRSPLWSGGGIIFGPRIDSNFKKDLPKAMKMAATVSVLKNLIAEDKVAVIEEFKLKAIKTKEALEMLSQLKTSGNKITLITTDNNPQIRASFANVQGVNVITAAEMTVFNLFNSDFVVFEKSAIELIASKLNISKDKK